MTNTKPKEISYQERQNEERSATAQVRMLIAIIDDTSPVDVATLRHRWGQLRVIAQSMERY